MDYGYLRCRELLFGALHRVLDRSQRGQGMVEYSLVLALIAVVVIVVMSVTGKRVGNVFSNVSTDLGSLSTAAAKHVKHVKK
ncbi:MAG TPA: Flp family type IVb pilin [Candidatus Acidoferrales bacterium]|nr:Flp family type IVb pilin [Candidatus Acidoferrales bacterium]